jgi:hypothetical protein
MKPSYIEFALRRSGRGYLFASADGKISIANPSLEAVVEPAVRLISEFVRGGTLCGVRVYVSLGPRLRQLRDAGATCRVGLKEPQQDKSPAQPERPGWQMPGMPVPEPPPPVYVSWADYLQRTTRAERMVRCYAASKKANRKRLMSNAPTTRLSGRDVWTIIELARGRCAYCGSLAVEKRPSSLTGAPIAWAQVGRRIGSLEHARWRYGGGDNNLDNLAWVCLWCNTWPSERRHHAEDYGGFYPNE